MRRRTVFTRALLGLLAALVVLGIVEAGLRFGLGPPPPPVRVYTVIPPGEGAFVVKEGMVAPTYVSVEPPPPVPTTPSRPRWIAVGASSVHGGSLGVFRGGEFPDLAGRRAGVEVLNYASPGLDSYDLVHVVGQLDVLSPTGVIVYTGHNDVGNAWFQQRFGTAEALAEAKIGALLARSRIFVELRRGLSPVEGKARAVGRQGNIRSTIDDGSRERAERYFEMNLRRIAWTCIEAGWKLILVTPVSNVTAEPAHLRGGANDAARALWAEAQAVRATDPMRASELLEHARDRDVVGIRASRTVQQSVRTVAAETGATLIDAQRDLPREPGLDEPAASLFADGDPLHLSADGHRALAVLLADAIRAAGGEVGDVGAAQDAGPAGGAGPAGHAGAAAE